MWPKSMVDINVHEFKTVILMSLSLAERTAILMQPTKLIQLF